MNIWERDAQRRRRKIVAASVLGVILVAVALWLLLPIPAVAAMVEVSLFAALWLLFIAAVVFLAVRLGLRYFIVEDAEGEDEPVGPEPPATKALFDWVPAWIALLCLGFLIPHHLLGTFGFTGRLHRLEFPLGAWLAVMFVLATRRRALQEHTDPNMVYIYIDRAEKLRVEGGILKPLWYICGAGKVWLPITAFFSKSVSTVRDSVPFEDTTSTHGVGVKLHGKIVFVPGEKPIDVEAYSKTTKEDVSETVGARLKAFTTYRIATVEIDELLPASVEIKNEARAEFWAKEKTTVEKIFGIKIIDVEFEINLDGDALKLQRQKYEGMQFQALAESVGHIAPDVRRDALTMLDKLEQTSNTQRVALEGVSQESISNLVDKIAANPEAFKEIGPALIGFIVGKASGGGKQQQRKGKGNQNQAKGENT